jgi:hypothetical protein
MKHMLTASPLMPSSKKMAALLSMRWRLIGVGFEGQSILYLKKYKSQQYFSRAMKNNHRLS